MDHLLIAVTIFVVTYAIIIFEVIPPSIAAFCGGILMILSGILGEEKAFHSINLEVIFLLVGMMIIVHIMSETGIFQWVAITVAQLVRGRPFPLMALLVIVTAVFSAFLDNVTTILLIAPVSIVLTEQLKLDPVPYLIAEVMASNIGGTATLIGDPPNILIGTAANLSFNDFLINLSPVVLINMVVFIATIWLIWGRKLKVSRDLRARIMELDASRSLKDKTLLKKSGGIMGLVIIGFISHSAIGVGPAVVVMLGALSLMIITKKKPEALLEKVEWNTLFFFMGLFILVEGVVEVGLLKIVADKALHLTSGNLEITSVLILWLSGILSGIVDNIPYTATVIPMIKNELIPSLSQINPDIAPEAIRYALWWSLSLGACFGGNGTLVGASANVVAAGIAAKNKTTISFMKFTKYGVLITLESLVIGTAYLWFRYLT